MTLSLAISDAKRFTNAGGFEVNLTLTPPGYGNYSVKGIGMVHNNSVSTDGIPVNAKNVHITIVESDLIALNYPVRKNGQVNMFNHLCSFPDSNGNIQKYIIKEVMPDQTLGLITCILGDYGRPD